MGWITSRPVSPSPVPTRHAFAGLGSKPAGPAAASGSQTTRRQWQRQRPLTSPRRQERPGSRCGSSALGCFEWALHASLAGSFPIDRWCSLALLPSQTGSRTCSSRPSVQRIRRWRLVKPAWVRTKVHWHAEAPFCIVSSCRRRRMGPRATRMRPADGDRYESWTRLCAPGRRRVGTRDARIRWDGRALVSNLPETSRSSATSASARGRNSFQKKAVAHTCTLAVTLGARTIRSRPPPSISEQCASKN